MFRSVLCFAYSYVQIRPIKWQHVQIRIHYRSGVWTCSDTSYETTSADYRSGVDVSQCQRLINIVCVVFICSKLAMFLSNWDVPNAALVERECLRCKYIKEIQGVFVIKWKWFFRHKWIYVYVVQCGSLFLLLLAVSRVLFVNDLTYIFYRCGSLFLLLLPVSVADSTSLRIWKWKSRS